MLPPVLLPGPEADIGALGGGGSIDSDSDNDDGAPNAHVLAPVYLFDLYVACLIWLCRVALWFGLTFVSCM